MTTKNILLIQGHPDTVVPHLCHALADAYAEGARQEGHEVRTINIAALDFPILRSQQAWEEGELPPTLRQAQSDMLWAGHIVLFFPLWMGDMPALLKGFLEQVMRPGFAFGRERGSSPFTQKKLKGRSARVVVTKGMPALVYRRYFRAHSVKTLERNILGFGGIGPVHETLVGMVGEMKPDAAAEWMGKLRRLGRQAD
jgi:putative NADPH-quinone reductase